MRIIRITNIPLSFIVFVIIVLYMLVVFIENIQFRVHKFENVHSEEYAKINGSADDIKVILLWNPYFHNYDYIFGTDGKQFFGQNRCPVNNCIVTYKRSLRPIEDYDAVVFHSWGFKINNGPQKRSPHQYYAFVSLESPSRNKIDSSFNGFFNWTLTYRFDSDFFWPYFKMKDRYGSVISPSAHPKWEPYNRILPLVNTSIVSTFERKSKKVAWFVSHCSSDNLRGQYVRQLQKYIQVDIYGDCGPLKCSRTHESDCFEMLKNDYYFYLALENSHCKDYMTEKAYNSLMYDTIPVLFGAANYTNFIPPYSYLDANILDPEQLAQVMNALVNNPEEYAKYFWWKGLYTFHNLGNEYILADPELHPFCEMCKALNEPDLKPKSYQNLVEWWQEGFESSVPVCVKPKKSFY